MRERYGKHRRGEAARNGSSQFARRVLRIVGVENRHASQSPRATAAELGQPIVVGAARGVHKLGVADCVVLHLLRRVQHRYADAIGEVLGDVALGRPQCVAHVIDRVGKQQRLDSLGPLPGL